MSKSGQLPMNLLGPTAPDEDVWDDTELIRQYNRSVRNWRKNEDAKVEGNSEETPGPGPWREVSKEENKLSAATDQLNQNTLPGVLEIGSWIIGSPCRALYSEDGLEYEAKIVGIEGPRCTVRFVGYGNEEQVNLSDLKTTHGKKSRDKQRRAALQYQQRLNFGVDIGDAAERISTISLTSSMVNNCGESICRDRDDTVSNSFVLHRPPLQASTPKMQALKSNLKVLETLNIPNNIPPPSQPIDNVDGASAIPSAAEATIDSSSSSSELSSVVDDIAQDVPPNNSTTNGDWENFNNTMPQFRFPVPPLPLSFSNREGRFDFGRGELPSLLMSWYMAGYQAGFFDARQEFIQSQKRNRSGTKKKKE